MREIDSSRTLSPNGRVIGESDAATVRCVCADRYQAWFDDARRLRALITELETLSLTTIEDTENWNPS